MAVIDNQIFVGSPFKVVKNGVNLTKVVMDIWIYTGVQGAAVVAGTSARASTPEDRPLLPTHTLTSTAVGSTTDKYSTFEISSLTDGIIKESYNGNPESSKADAILWVDYQLTTTIKGVGETIEALIQNVAFDGYTYFEDGANYQDESAGMFTADVLHRIDGEVTEIPVNTDTTNSVRFKNAGILVYTNHVTSSTSSGNQVKYIGSAVSSTFDSIEVTDNDFNVRTIDVPTLPVGCHTPYKITFINKYGLLQSVWFYGNNKEMVKLKSRTFNVNTSATGTYSINHAQMYKQRESSKHGLMLNSGFYPEASNETFKELMQSTHVWIDFDNKVLPININTSSLNMQTHLNDNAINYSFKADFAFNKINNI